MEPRVPRHRHVEPLDAIWLATVERLGFRVVRSADVHASTDGRGTITLGTPETLDPDDMLAQLLLHELCHALVEGDDASGQPDWGLDNQTERDVPREHACLRLQAFLASRHGLREVLAPTTDFRAFYDALPADPLTPRTDPSVQAAILGAQRAECEPWAPHLHDALVATAAISRIAAPFALAADGMSGGRPSLLSEAASPAGAHPTGLALGHAGTCGTCAWHHEAGRTRHLRCRQADDARVSPEWPGCERWEPALDCHECGACCRSAYQAVLVSPRDPVIRLHPELVVQSRGMREVKRSGDRCAALAGGPESSARYTCTIYDARPRPCREFEIAGEHCLVARRRVGLTL